MSVEAFAHRLCIPGKFHICPSELDAIEKGETEAPDKVVKQLPDISNAYDITMGNIFGERWEKLKEKGAEAI